MNVGLSLETMINLLIILFIFASFSALLSEIHCRIQIKIIARSKTKILSLMHYLLMTPLAVLPVLFMTELRSITSALLLTELEKAMIELGVVIIFVLPSIYIVLVRYSGLIDKMDNWRKS